MYDINLLPHAKNQGEKRESLGRLSVAAIAFASIILLAGGVYGILHYLESNVLKEQQELDGKVKVYTTINETKKNIRQREDKVKRMSGVMEAATKDSVLNTRLLERISAISPENVFLMNYSVAKAGDINLSGRSKDRESIAHYLYTLRETGLFSEVSVKSITTNASEGGKSADYSFTASLKLK